jgi:hypothetical protein
MLEAEEAKKVLTYLETYGYASPEHVTQPSPCQESDRQR